MLLDERQQKEITEQIRPMMEIPTSDQAADVIQVHHPKERGEDYKSRDKLDASSNAKPLEPRNRPTGTP